VELFEGYDGEYRSDDHILVEYILMQSRDIYLESNDLYGVNFLKLYKFYLDKYSDAIYELIRIDIKRDYLGEELILDRTYRNNDQELIKFLQGNGNKLPINNDSLEIFNEYRLERSDSFIELMELFINSLTKGDINKVLNIGGVAVAVSLMVSNKMDMSIFDKVHRNIVLKKVVVLFLSVKKI
jgi:hypothetical protein